MTDYIKRENVARMLETAHIISDGEYCGYCTEDINLNRISAAADVAEVRHGHWGKELPYKSVGGEYKKALICSECNSFFVSDGNKPWQMHNFCPNCGAKMDKEDWQ